jgi:hypothetical protein
MLLAAGAAVALNGSYLLQHAGSPKAVAVDARRPAATVVALLRSPLWTLGAGVGMLGWALHVGAMREAPLSLVQAFVAGGLALAVPMAAVGLHQRLTTAERQALALMVAALVLLAAGLHGGGGRGTFAPRALALWMAGLAAGAGVLVAVGGPVALGTAGGLLYGAADLALGAVAGHHGAPPGWVAAALVATAGAFFAFQRGLQHVRPLPVIAAMTTATNAGSIAGALVVFGDPLGPVHALGFTLVLVPAWRLAPAQARLAAAAA